MLVPDLSIFVSRCPLHFETTNLTQIICFTGVDGCEEVAEIFKILRRRHILPDSLRVGYFAFFPPYSLGILEPCLTLQDIGVHNLSTLYIRAKVLGGTRAPTEGIS